MDKQKFLTKIEEICELPAGSLSGSEALQGSRFLDSLAMLGLIAMLDKEWKVSLPVSEIVKLGTLDNLYEVVAAMSAINT